VAKQSAGVLLYRREPVFEVLLVHPGGPFWRHKQAGAWQIPKGLIEPDEDPAATARREVREELGVAICGTLVPLDPIRQAGGKTVIAFAAEQDLDATAIVSNLFEIEWPPHSGKMASFPEIDAARWMALDEAHAMILPSQRPLLDQLARLLAV